MITVHRKHGPPWAFEWDEIERAWLHKTARNVYCLFADYDRNGIHVWIGRYAPGPNCWFTIEARLGATHIETFNGVFYFRRKPDKREGAVLSALSYLKEDHVQDNKHRMGLLGSQNIDRAVKLLEGEISLECERERD